MPLNINILIIGYGAIGKKHAITLEKIVPKKNIYILSSNKFHKYKSINSLNRSISDKFDYIIISSKTSDHIKHITLIDKIFLDKKVLIEKPVFNNLSKKNFKNNSYYVGYNLRYHPFFKYIKKEISRKKILNVNIKCFSNLLSWKKFNKNNNYNFSKEKGGGVHFDLSHELDYLIWIFGDIKKFKSVLSKNANITKNSNDIFYINGFLKNGSSFQLTLTYFSKFERRELQVDLLKKSYLMDFFKNILLVNDINKNNKVIKYHNHLKDTFLLMHKDILFNNKPKIAASLMDGLKLLKILSQR